MAIRVLVADDSAFMRRAITRMLETAGDIQVLAAARDGAEAVQLAVQHKPDVITLDVEMPNVDGLTALRRIMRDAPTRVLMFSSLTTEGSSAAITAMRLGAADVMAKDQSQISLAVTNLQDDLVAKVRGLGRSKWKPRWGAPAPAGDEQPPAAIKPGAIDLICIGSSTGGPPALETIVGRLSPSLQLPVVIAQHMPAMFTESMVERLDRMARLKVVHATADMTLEPGVVHVLQGDRNGHVRRGMLNRYRLVLNREPKDTRYWPSVDELIGSAAEAAGRRVLGAVLTGIGDDGLAGGRKLHAAGGVLLAQSEATCVVYGMPKSVTQAGIVHASLSPEAVADAINRLARPARSAA